MKRSTGLALAASGAIAALAVNVPLSYVSMRLAGLGLMFAGLTGLGVPQRAYHWLRAHQEQFTGALGRFMEPPLPPGPQAPLNDLLGPDATAGTPASSPR